MTLKSSTMIGGKGAHTRHPSEFYVTPPEATRALIEGPVRNLLPRYVWEPACGNGAISKVLIEAGFDVIATDLHDRGYGIGGVDFLKTRNLSCDWISTNPPFDTAREFILHALTFDVPVAMLLKMTFWNVAGNLAIFEARHPAYVMPLTWRPAMAPERGKSPTMEFCWTFWLPPKASPRPCEFFPLRKPK